MKKKFWVVPLMLIAALCLCFLPGCGGPSVEEVVTADVTEALDTVKNCDDDFVEEITESAGDDFSKLGIDGTEFAKAYLKGFKYKVGDVTVDEDKGKATVNVTITCKSMNTIVADFTQKLTEQTLSSDTDMSEDDIMKLAGPILMQSTKDCATHKTEVTFGYTQNDDGEWEADDSAETEIQSALS